MGKQSQKDKENIGLVAGKIKEMPRTVRSEIMKPGLMKRLISGRGLSPEQRKQSKIIRAKIAGMSQSEKLKLMTPAGVQKLLDESAEIMRAQENK